MLAAESARRREIAFQIWQAGVQAVQADRLVADAVQWTDRGIHICGQDYWLNPQNRLVVVGGGKAGAGMTLGLLAALPAEFVEQRVTGWVNVPADCVPSPPPPAISLHPARPPHRNEPTPAAAAGTAHILEMVHRCEPGDLCLVLISGGGSALLPAPAAGISLEDKLIVTQRLSRGGATIEELNTVRRTISAIKGGQLAAACRADRLVTLIISDVIGDDLATIASGPTVPADPQPARCREILTRFLGSDIPASVLRHLKTLENASHTDSARDVYPSLLRHHIVGSNRLAIEAAGKAAQQLGYEVIDCGSEHAGPAHRLGEYLVDLAFETARAATADQKFCLLVGGETTVEIEPGVELGKGGRNQEVALAAIRELGYREQTAADLAARVTLFAGGSDGEDGPTDAAGGFADLQALHRAQQLQIDLPQELQRHNAYAALQQCECLVKTGPTHTNVMDVAVVLID